MIGLDEKVTISVTEMSQICGISRTKAYELAHSRGFPTITIGGRLLIHREKLLEWLDSHTGAEGGAL